MLDGSDRSARAGTTGARSARVANPNGGNFINILTHLTVELAQTINVDAGTQTSSIDALLSGEEFFLTMFTPPGLQLDGATAINVQCVAAPYCRAGTGTATTVPWGSGAGVTLDALWRSYDPDRDGLPNISRSSTGGDNFSINMRPRTTTAGIAIGDVYNYIFTTPTGRQSAAQALDFFFMTVPAVKSWSDGTTTGEFTYPVAEGAPGTGGMTPLTAASQSLSFTVWRPQRPAIARAETGDWVDMGGLMWNVDVSVFGQDGVNFCTAANFSNLSSLARRDGEIVDFAADAPANAANTVRFTLDVAGCLAANGISSAGRNVAIHINANDERGGTATQTVHFQMP